MSDNPCTICGELEDIIELLYSQSKPFSIDGEVIAWDRALSYLEVQLLYRYPYSPIDLQEDLDNHKNICNVWRQYGWLGLG